MSEGQRSLPQVIAELKNAMRKDGRLTPNLEHGMDSILRSCCFTAPEVYPLLFGRLELLVRDHLGSQHPYKYML